MSAPHTPGWGISENSEFTFVYGCARSRWQRSMRWSLQPAYHPPLGDVVIRAGTVVAEWYEPGEMGRHMVMVRPFAAYRMTERGPMRVSHGWRLLEMEVV